ncbi:MAG: periplasmic heavy metal sensor [Chloroflexota bacterium]|nr:periplasmic heavy metal sensor [Chloroflexota bacterium]
MRRILVVLVVSAGLFGGVAGFFAATAQEGTPSGQGHAGHNAASPVSDSPYADRYDPAAVIRSLIPEEVAQIQRGEGAGFALPAELNGVPGPRHVLDLATQLGLSQEQRMSVQQIADEMRGAVIPAGERYLAALQALEEAFRAGSLTEETLPGQVAEVSRLEGELVAAHLVAHLQTAKVLTPDQVALYQQLRGYEAGSTPGATPAV